MRKVRWRLNDRTRRLSLCFGELPRFLRWLGLRLGCRFGFGLCVSLVFRAKIAVETMAIDRDRGGITRISENGPFRRMRRGMTTGDLEFFGESNVLDVARGAKFDT